jgi:hypothetical protein
MWGAPNEVDLQGNLAEERHKNRTADGCFLGVIGRCFGDTLFAARKSGSYFAE